jgi:hypothetical protein
MQSFVKGWAMNYFYSRRARNGNLVSAALGLRPYLHRAARIMATTVVIGKRGTLPGLPGWVIPAMNYLAISVMRCSFGTHLAAMITFDFCGMTLVAAVTSGTRSVALSYGVDAAWARLLWSEHAGHVSEGQVSRPPDRSG